MPVNAIIHGHIEGATTVWYPKGAEAQQALTHLRVSGVTGQQLVAVLGGGPPDTFVHGLHDLGGVPTAALDPDDGGLLHAYAGGSRFPGVWTADDGGPLTLAERQALLASRGPWDVWLRGRGFASINGGATDKSPYCGLLASAALLVLLGPAVIWRDDLQDWADAPARFKRADGSPRRNIDDATIWAETGKYSPPVEPSP